MNRILALLPFPAKACNFACLGEPFNRPWGAFLDFCMGATMAAELATTHRFRLVLIKPSHYDDDGYVIQWWRSSIPTNSLSIVYTLAEDAGQRRALGADVEIDIIAMDEANTRVRVNDIIALIRASGGFGMVGLVGVQSNQYPRALDIARPLRAAGIKVVIGGFHVSGVLAMLPGPSPELKEALDLGCSLFAGEAEGRIDRVLQDAAADRLQPIESPRRQKAAEQDH